MFVFRIENKELKGPYKGSASYLIEFDDYKHPDMYRDLGNEHYQRYKQWSDKNRRCENLRFGFESLDMLDDWFDIKTRTNLHDKEFSISRYRMRKEHVFKANKQLVFDLSKSTLMHKLNIKSFERI